MAEAQRFELWEGSPADYRGAYLLACRVARVADGNEMGTFWEPPDSRKPRITGLPAVFGVGMSVFTASAVAR